MNERIIKLLTTIYEEDALLDLAADELIANAKQLRGSSAKMNKAAQRTLEGRAFYDFVRGKATSADGPIPDNDTQIN